MAEGMYERLNGLQLDIRMLAHRILRELLGDFKRLNEEGRVKKVMEEQAGQWGMLLERLDSLMQAIRQAGTKRVLKEVQEEKKLMVQAYGLLTSGFPDEHDREDLSAFLMSLIAGSTQHIPRIAKDLVGQ